MGRNAHGMIDLFISQAVRSSAISWGKPMEKHPFTFPLKKDFSPIKTIILNNSNAGHRKSCLMWGYKTDLDGVSQPFPLHLVSNLVVSLALILMRTSLKGTNLQ
jgi:hypothetical protein